jgi:hypothetical protein
MGDDDQGKAKTGLSADSMLQVNHLRYFAQWASSAMVVETSVCNQVVPAVADTWRIMETYSVVGQSIEPRS